MNLIVDESVMTMTYSENDRRQDIDYFRGFGIICMILGHIIIGDNLFNKIVHSFHMPMFFIISGFFYKERNDYIDYAKKKAKTLLLPYLIFGAMHYIIYIVYYYHDSEMPKIDPLRHLLLDNTEGLPIAGALWFLTALFFCELLYNLCVTVVKKRIASFLIIAALTIIGLEIPWLFGFRLPLAMDVSFTCLPFYAFGNLFRIKDECSKQWRPTFTVALLILGIIFSIVNGTVNIRAGQYAVIPLFYITAILLSVGLLKLSSVICKNSKLKLLDALKNEMCFIGKNSIIYLTMNQLIILIIAKMFQFIHTPKPIVIISSFFVTMIILHFCTIVLVKKPLNKLLGK